MSLPVTGVTGVTGFSIMRSTRARKAVYRFDPSQPVTRHQGRDS